MFRRSFLVSLVLTITSICLNTFSWPNQLLSKSAKEPAYILVLAAATQFDDGDLESSLSQLNKLIERVNGFDAFYTEKYNQYSGADRLSPYEILRMLESLTKIQNVFESLTNRSIVTLLLKSNESLDLEISALKNLILIQKLTLEIRGIHRDLNTNPERQRVMFENVNMIKIASVEEALKVINQTLPRLQYLNDAKSRSCLSLF